jgi:hypothetical protein
MCTYSSASERLSSICVIPFVQLTRLPDEIVSFWPVTDFSNRDLHLTRKYVFTWFSAAEGARKHSPEINPIGVKIRCRLTPEAHSTH